MGEKLNKFKIGSQNYRLIEALWEAPLQNWQISHDLHILNYCARIHEIRSKGYDVLCHRIPDRRGVCVYQLIR